MNENIIKESYLNIAKNADKFEEYYNFLVEYNKKVNLTAITEKEDVYIKHFLDSVLGESKIPRKAEVVDVGSGAGFPGLPLKIIRDDINLTMLDSLNKRITFLNELCSKIKTPAKTVHARAEEYAINYREKHDIALARAVARTVTLVEYLLPLVKVGGKVLLYKGSNYLEELEEAKYAINLLGGEIKEILSFSLPEEAGERNIIVINKVKNTLKIYPRGGNLPKSKPLIK